MSALLVHTAGNWLKKADLGGNLQELGIAYASAVKEASIALEEEGKSLAYEKNPRGYTSQSYNFEKNP